MVSAGSDAREETDARKRRSSPGLGAKTLTARLGNPEDSAQLSHGKLKAALCHTDERQAIHPMLLRHGDTTAGPELHKYKHPNRHSDWHCHCTR